MTAINTIWPTVVLVPDNAVCWTCLPGPALVPVFPGVSESLWLAWAVAAAGGAILLAGCSLTLRRRRRRGRGMLLGGLFPMVAAGFFCAIALPLTTLGASAPGAHYRSRRCLPGRGRRLLHPDGPHSLPPAS